MGKSSLDLLEKAKKIIAEAKKIEEKECLKLGKIVMKLYKENKLLDTKLKTEIEKFFKNKSKKEA